MIEKRIRSNCAPITSTSKYWIPESRTISTDLSTSTSAAATHSGDCSGSGFDKNGDLSQLLKLNIKVNGKMELTPTPVDKIGTTVQALDMGKLIRNYEESGRTTTTSSSRNIRKTSLERRFSTGTLNRLILVAQALESEVEYRRQTDVSGSRIVIALRTINLLLLLIIDGLILSGVGQYYSNFGGKRSLMLTPDKWYYNIYSKLPITFSEMRLNCQYFATAVTTIIFLITLFFHVLHIYWTRYSRLLCMCYSFGAVPFLLFVFGLEMHYSTCPWIDDFYRAEIMRRDYNSVEPYFDTQCGISGWALAGIFSLLSCSLFIGEGLVSAFFRSESSRRRIKTDDLL